MTKERLIELAKQAGWEYADDDRGFEPLWAFAELVRADEREQGQKWFDAVAAQHKQAILAEREACAKVCEQRDEDGECPDQWGWHSGDYAKAIRNRSNTTQGIIHHENHSQQNP